MSAAACPVSFGGLDRLGILVIQSGTRAFDQTHGHGLEDVPLGEDSLQPVAVHDEHGSDATANHVLGGLRDRLVRRYSQQLPGHVVGDHRHRPRS